MRLNKTMTAEQKNAAAQFLDLAADYLLDGYRRPHPHTGFEDDAAVAETAAPPAGDGPEPDRGTYGQTQAGEGAALTNGDAGTRTSVFSPGDADTRASAFLSGDADTLEKVAEEVRRCGACRLCERRTQGVPGEGVSAPLVLVVGEAPGADEDASGRPFVGKAGQLLDKMLASIGLSRQKNCYIANIVKCRPPQNRDPQPDEIIFCGRFLKRQIALLKPKIIFCAGRIAAQTMLRTTTGIGKLRGHFEVYRTEDSFDELDGFSPGDSSASIPLLATYHPSALLRDEGLKRPAWEDLKTLRARLAETDDNYARETAGQQ
ncbi:MAG: uracil-DNA glycosylase [Treponema sp.]|jgi:DNA polymerase|nr:uracil-DNA glycosylase [Treponema sp.]